MTVVTAVVALHPVRRRRLSAAGIQREQSALRDGGPGQSGSRVRKDGGPRKAAWESGQHSGAGDQELGQQAQRHHQHQAERPRPAAL
jgi:hypothetical protein